MSEQERLDDIQEARDKMADIEKKIRELDDSNLITRFLLLLQSNKLYICNDDTNGALELTTGSRVIDLRDSFIADRGES